MTEGVRLPVRGIPSGQGEELLSKRYEEKRR
jgi:hypothetical protein